MEDIITQVKSLAANGNDLTRKNILQSLQELSYSIESPQETMQRVLYSHMQVALVRVGVDLKLFNILSENKDPLTVDELATKTGAAPQLLARILRYLASVGTIKETSKDTFTANSITNTLTIDGVQAGVYHNVNNIGPVIWALPDYLIENKYQDITDQAHTPFQKAYNTDLVGFVYAQTVPEMFECFSRFMQVTHMGMPSWFDVYPIAEKTQNLDPDQVLFVDVGGGVGHQSVALRKHLPDVKNKIIVQDIAVVMPYVIPHEGVEAMEHDFFQEQPIKGARFYYLRNILHDWPEEKALVILKNLSAALGPDGFILIDEMVVPNTGAHFHATQIDITMMITLGSLERRSEQWYSLMEKAGLKINQIYTYADNLRDSILECVRV